MAVITCRVCCLKASWGHVWGGHFLKCFEKDTLGWRERDRNLRSHPLDPEKVQADERVKCTERKEVRALSYYVFLW